MRYPPSLIAAANKLDSDWHTQDEWIDAWTEYVVEYQRWLERVKL